MQDARTASEDVIKKWPEMVIANTQGVRRKVAQIIGAQVALQALRFETANANEQPPTALSGLNSPG